MKSFYLPTFFTKKRFQSALIIATGIFLFLTPFTAFAITVSPPRLELTADPGRSTQSKFEVTNESQYDTVYYTQVENFEAGDESGNPQFVPAREGLATWVDVQGQVTVRAGETRTIPFTVNVPRSAEPGGYFASIFVRTTPPPQNGGEVSIGARLGTLILFRVNGEMKEGVNILEFSAKDKQRFFISLPVEFYYRFQNTGADRVKPEGNIVVKNLIGFTAKNLTANRQEGSVLPRSIRRFESAWINAGGGEENPSATTPVQTSGGFLSSAKSQFRNFAFGYYTAQLDIRYGENNNTANAKYSFFIVPWQLLSIVILGLLIILIILRFLLRIYTRRIIRQHQNLPRR